MSHLPSLPEARLLDLFRAYPDAARPLLDYHEVVMRGPSSLTVAQRELVAAYVSGLNACGYCQGIHETTARAFGVEADLLSALLHDPESAGVEPALLPLLAYVRRLALEPSRVTPSDVQAVLDAGWDERAVHDAASVCGLFSLMNRLVDGLGISADADYTALSGTRLAEQGYAGLKDLL